MEGNQNIRIIYIESVKKLRKAVRLEASLFQLLIFFDEHLQESKGSEYKEVFITIAVWLLTFLLLLEENKREWEELAEQLHSIGEIRSIQQWINIREELLEPAFWNNFRRAE